MYEYIGIRYEYIGIMYEYIGIMYEYIGIIQELNRKYMGQGQYLVYSSKSLIFEECIIVFQVLVYKQMLSFLKSVFSFSMPQLNDQKIKMSRILLSIKLHFWLQLIQEYIEYIGRNGFICNYIMIENLQVIGIIIPQLSMDWLKGKSKGNHVFCFFHGKYISFPLNQSND